MYCDFNVIIGNTILHVIPERRLRRIRDLTKRFGS
jgi:hypothetical protein